MICDARSWTSRSSAPLQSLDRGGRVLYVGSFSKVMLPTLRLGFLIAQASLQPALRTAKQLTDWHGETPTQAALARFIDEGLLARHIRKASREYARRHARIVATLQRDFAAWLQLVPSAAGLHLAARVRHGARVDVERVARDASGAGIGIGTLSRFCAGTPVQQGLAIGYGTIATSRIDEGLERLAAIVRRVSAAKSPAR